jgi:hypothetical protein
MLPSIHLVSINYFILCRQLILFSATQQKSKLAIPRDMSFDLEKGGFQDQCNRSNRWGA